MIDLCRYDDCYYWWDYYSRLLLLLYYIYIETAVIDIPRGRSLQQDLSCLLD